MLGFEKYNRSKVVALNGFVFFDQITGTIKTKGGAIEMCALMFYETHVMYGGFHSSMYPHFFI